MMAWTSPGSMVREMPRRISLSPTRACRFLIWSMSAVVLYQYQSEVILELATTGQAGERLQLVDQLPTPVARGRLLDAMPARVLPNAVGHPDHHPRGRQFRHE